MDSYHNALRPIKEVHYESMKYHKSADATLRNKGLIRILEIGAGSGNYLSYLLNSNSAFTSYSV